VKPHSVFLRSECILPERLDPLTATIAENWKLVEEIPAEVLDTMIRQRGWHFMWVDRPCSRKGFGKTEEGAIQRALTHALHAVASRFNAAELVSLQVNRSLGLNMAIVTVQPRQIQQHSWLEDSGEAHPQTVSVR
jgi:hypothetical protein